LSSIFYRTADLTAGTGRTVFGVVVPYGQVAEVSDGGRPYRERFDFGAFSRSISERGSKVKLFTGHETRKLPVGKAVELREASDGLHAAFELADTTDGRDALELVRSGTVDSFSVGFRGIRDRMDGDVVVRTEAALMEVSLVGLPTYSGAAIAGVRSKEPPFIAKTVAAARLRLLNL
jgi:HK97 family phage prohead protease